MKKVFSVFFVLSAVFFSSCSLDYFPCSGVKCVEGYCDQGTCKCDFGWEGIACDKKVVSKFVGTFLTTETCSNSDTTTYSSVVSVKDDLLQYITISPLKGYSVQFVVDGFSMSATSNQKVGDYTVNGSGVMTEDNKSIQLSLTFDK